MQADPLPSIPWIEIISAGGHALRLAQRGYAVTGVDRSTAMLAEARQEAARSGITRTRGQAEWSGQGLEFLAGTCAAWTWANCTTPRS